MDPRIDFLDVEEDTRQRGREVEGAVEGVIGAEDEVVGVGVGGEGGGEEGGQWDVGWGGGGWRV